MGQKSSFSKFLKPSLFNYYFIEIIFSILCSFLIILYSIYYQERSKEIKKSFLEFLNPFAKAIIYPTTKINEYITNINLIFHTKALNQELQNQISEYEVKLSEMYHLQIENYQLKELLNLEAPPTSRKISARIIFDTSSSISPNVFIDVGEKEGVKINNPVFNKNGLIGRVISTKNNISEVLLISNNQSILPVYSIESKKNFFAKGKGDFLEILHLDEPDLLIDGELVLTTSSSGYFKEGIRVGKVKKNKEKIIISPFSDKNDSTYVKILVYNFEKEHPNFNKNE